MTCIMIPHETNNNDYGIWLQNCKKSIRINGPSMQPRCPTSDVLPSYLRPRISSTQALSQTLKAPLYLGHGIIRAL